jgi:broad specificity phosphatase PhoE
VTCAPQRAACAQVVFPLCILRLMTRAALWCRACRPHRVSHRRKWIAVASSGHSAASEPAPQKTIILMRHGVTEMNEYLSKNRWNDPLFIDPKLYDTKLTPGGERQACAKRTSCANLWLTTPPQLLVCSPQRRALQTAELAFATVPAPLPRLVTSLCRERLYHSSDVGRSPRIVSQEFPMYSGWGELPEVWWHAPGDTPDPLAHDPEPEDVFLDRCRQFVGWLAARPEKNIAVVTHWGVIEALTQREFANCEIGTYRLADLIVRRPRELVPPG